MFASPTDGNTRVRAAEPDEAAPVADLWLDSRRAAAPAIPPPAHTDAEVRAWFRDVVFASDSLEVWVIGPHGRPDAMMVLDGDWIEQLYVAPAHQRQGLGARLISFAQSRRPELRLWTFEANHPARAFYEELGFCQTGAPSSNNEERAAAVCYRWSRAG